MPTLDRSYTPGGELCFEASGTMVPEGLPARPHGSGGQSNAPVDIRLEVAHVGGDGAEVVHFSTNSISLLQIFVDDRDRASPNLVVLVLAHLVLRPSVEASASKMGDSVDLTF